MTPEGEKRKAFFKSQGIEMITPEDVIAGALSDNKSNMEDTVKSTDIYELVGSGKLATAIEDLALLILVQREDLPVESIIKEVTALQLAVRGLQDPESDMFVDKNNEKNEDN